MDPKNSVRYQLHKAMTQVARNRAIVKERYEEYLADNNNRIDVHSMWLTGMIDAHTADLEVIRNMYNALGYEYEEAG